MKNIFFKNENRLVDRAILFVGIIFRLLYGLKATLFVNQHDVLLEGGHFHYASHIFSTLALPNSRYGQFYQPPLNAIMQALFMRLEMVFIKPVAALNKTLNLYLSGDYNLLFENKKLYDYIEILYSNTKILSIIYSILTLFLIYKILKLTVYIHKRIYYVSLIMCSIFPGVVYLAGQYNNDSLSYLFIFLSIYLSLIWYKEQKLSTIILLSISISLGMLTKISTSTVAFVIALMMLIVLVNAIRKQDKAQVKNILIQWLIFAIITIPFALSYSIRNLILFNQPFNYVRKLAESNPLYVKNDNLFDRLFPFYFSRIVVPKYNIYHALNEFNIWIDLIKTSILGEYTYGNFSYYFANVIMLFCGILIYLFSIISYIVVFAYYALRVIKYRANLLSKLDLKYLLIGLSLALMTIGITSFTFFNLNYPASCSSHFRYIMYVIFASSVLIPAFFDILSKCLNAKVVTISYSFYTIILILGLATFTFIALL